MNALDVDLNALFVDTNALSVSMDVDDAQLDDAPGLTNAPDPRRNALSLDRNVDSVDIDDADAHEAVVLAPRNDRLVLIVDVPPHFTRIDVGRLQSPMPSFVVTR